MFSHNFNSKGSPFLNAALDEYGLFLSISDIMAILNVSRPVVTKLIHTGQIPSVRIGARQYRVNKGDFIVWWNQSVAKAEQDRIHITFGV